MAKRSYPSFLLYQEENGRWRWSYADASGNEVAAAKASYGTREACLGAIRALQQSEGQPAYAFRPAGAEASKSGANGEVLDLDPR